MKKIYSIMLLALFSCVTAWADNVAKIGDTEFATLQAAINSLNNASNKIAAGTKATIQLLANTTENVSIDMSAPTGTGLTQRVHVTLDLNSKVLNSTITVTGAGSSTARDTLVIANGEFNGSVVASSTTNKYATLILANGVSSTTGISLNDNNKTKFDVCIGTTSGDAISANLTFTMAKSNSIVTVKEGATLTGNVILNSKASLTAIGSVKGNISTGTDWGSFGKITLQSAYNKSLTLAGAGTLRLEGNGQFTGTGSSVTYADENTVKLTVVSDAAIYNPASETGIRGGGAATVTAGTVNFEPTVDPATKAVVYNGDGTWTVTDYKAQIGETKYADFVAAYDAATSGATITLLQNNNIRTNANFTKAVTTSGDYNLSVNDGVTVTFNNANTNIAKLGAYSGANVTLTAGTYALSGFEGNLTINGATVSKESAISLSKALVINSGELNANVNLAASTASFAMSNGTLNGNITTSSVYNTLNITGGAINGAINLTHFGDNLAIGGVTVVSENGPALRSMATNNLTISSGSYTNNSEGEVVEGGNGSYKLILQGGTYNKEPNAAYIPVGYAKVQSGLNWIVQVAASDFVSVSKNGGAAQNFSSVSDFMAYMPIAADGSEYVITLLRNYDLNVGDGLEVYATNSCTIDLNGYTLTISSNANKSKLLVGGELTINANGGAIVVPAYNGVSVLNGGKATINGGEFSGAADRMFYVDSEGELSIDGATIEGAACAVQNKGVATIKDCEISAGGVAAIYAVLNAGKMIMKGTSVDGVHGAVACQDSKGTLELSNCDLKAENFYALYVCTEAIVSAYDTKFLSAHESGSNTIYIGNNDSNNKFGLIYLYGGCKTDVKLYVQKKKDSDADVLFPVLVSTESDWYKAAMNGGEGPLPANVAYAAITEGADYEAGYRFGTNSTAADTKDATGTTNPWQQNTTWTDTPTGNDVPAANSAVVIPAGKEVVVSKSETETAAVAQQVFLGDGATLTVETGTTLTVGEGGVNIANGGQLVVEPGAVVTVGAAGLVTTEEEALVIEYSGENSGVFMIAPEVTENTQPKATVKMYSKAFKIADNNFRWQHFAIPTVGAPEEFTMPVATAVYYLDYNDPTTPWKTIGAVANMNTPFQGYNLTNWAAAPGTEYTFYGNIIGNGDGKMPFVGTGYNFCGNSYTAPIDIALMLQDIKNNPNVDVEPTINIYDTENDRYEPITKASLDAAGWMGTPVTTQIAPMQGFFLNLRTNTSGDIEVIDYSNSVWGNPSISTGASLAPKRAAADDSKGIKMIVSANDRQDNVLMLEKAEYSAAFDDDADASKMMSEHSFNLWANIDNAAQSIVATNDLENTILGFQTVEGGEFTISFKANNMDDEYMLLDITTGEKMAIAEGAQYTFTQESNVKNAARFEIVKIAKMPTAIENVETTAKAKGIYTITGQFVGRDYNNLPKGVYVIDGQKIVK